MLLPTVEIQQLQFLLVEFQHFCRKILVLDESSRKTGSSVNRHETQKLVDDEIPKNSKQIDCISNKFYKNLCEFTCSQTTRKSEF